MVATAPAIASATAPIGVFDSGVGGLSVLRHIRAQLPHEHLLYFADSGFAPYGDKPESVLVERSLAVAGFLIANGAKALVVACNTATVAAIKVLRAHYPDMPIVGVEPGLKPAAAASRNGKVGVLATSVTVAGAKFLLLRDQISAASHTQFLLQGCPGLVDRIELGELDSPAIRALLERYATPLLDQGADTLVLGCTHYPFVLAMLGEVIAQATSREIVLIDTGDAVARHLARLLATAGLLNPGVDTSGVDTSGVDTSGVDTSGVEASGGDASGVEASSLDAHGNSASAMMPALGESGTAGLAPSSATLQGFTSAGAPALSRAFANLLGIAPPVREVLI
ncbi:glutamate racemase [Massilia sp. CCM 8733]|uniref:Glutamate racemase n=2 Tax=Massilia mucilaginosa TaxID=2609282 RepID=A0ABX0P423_9BURK|nr:glutamate racemase [Massilia mucilaginosa]NHZ93839.1 glutamate racemase [Massilia mucilaginosa]